MTSSCWSSEATGLNKLEDIYRAELACFCQIQPACKTLSHHSSRFFRNLYYYFFSEPSTFTIHIATQIFVRSYMPVLTSFIAFLSFVFFICACSSNIKGQENKYDSLCVHVEHRKPNKTRPQYVIKTWVRSTGLRMNRCFSGGSASSKYVKMQNCCAQIRTKM